MKVIIAGGGTGGHLFPGIAVADEFRRRYPECRILFIGTERGIEKKVLPDLGYDLQALDVAGIKGKGFLGTVKAMGKIPRSIMESRLLIKQFRPHLVLGVGGYVSGPVVLMAHLMGIATAVAEQNAVPGLANKMLGRFVDRVFVSFEETEQCFPAKKVIITGNPIRSGFVGKGQDATKSENAFTVLVFGGSQGSRAINDAMMKAASYLGRIRESLQIIHQVGSVDMEDVIKAYHESRITAEVKPFIMNMADAFNKADLLICRAGATSIAEITAAGKAAILIPFPYAIADHQTKNAEILSRHGAAILIPESQLMGEKLAEKILHLFGRPETIKKIGENASGLGHPRAATDVVDACMDLLHFSYDKSISAPN
jgi:UDP-N-acetylglucosamine--N-acetylmuramyl-(pentapeptide) pyrophosphoryl-undecaprenol N-acetylglucosamine transferase